MVVCMGALQVFVVRFFFQVCNLSMDHYASANNILGRTEGLRVNEELEALRLRLVLRRIGTPVGIGTSCVMYHSQNGVRIVGIIG